MELGQPVLSKINAGSIWNTIMKYVNKKILDYTDEYNKTQKMKKTHCQKDKLKNL